MGTESVVLSHAGSASLPEQPVEVWIDHEHSEVTLSMDEFDSLLVTDFVTRALPERGVNVFQADALPRTNTAKHADYGLIVRLRGRRHPARVVELGDGRCTVVLCDPSLDLNQRCYSTAVNVLRELHRRGLKAVVFGGAVDGTVSEFDQDSGIDVFVLEECLAEPDIAQLSTVAEANAEVPERLWLRLVSARQLVDALRLHPCLAWDGNRAHEVRGVDSLPWVR
jgi:hypothetical protein